MDIDNMNLYEELNKITEKMKLTEEEKQRWYKLVLRLKNTKLNILLVGSTGVGKSTTINALFDMEIAKVGRGADPETKDVDKYELGNLILWDSPGLGDSPEKDAKHKKKIERILDEKDDNGNGLIDLCLVLVDGSNRDMGSTFECITDAVMPNIESERTIIAVNQCDIAMKGKGWNAQENKPEDELVKFLDDKVNSVMRRIGESTGIYLDVMYYSAKYKYNLSKLLYFIVKNTPEDKRLIIANKVNRNEANWIYNDEQIDYVRETRGFWEKEGGELGEALGELAFGRNGGKIGRWAGEKIGSAIDWLGSKVSGLFNWF